MQHYIFRIVRSDPPGIQDQQKGLTMADTFASIFPNFGFKGFPTAGFPTSMSDMMERQSAFMAQGAEHVTQYLDAIDELDQPVISACAQSTKAMTMGMLDVSKKMAELAQENVSAGQDAFTSMTKASSVQEAMGLQTEYARASVQRCMDGFGALSSAWMTVMQDAARPMTATAEGLMGSAMKAAE